MALRFCADPTSIFTPFVVPFNCIRGLAEIELDWTGTPAGLGATALIALFGGMMAADVASELVFMISAANCIGDSVILAPYSRFMYLYLRVIGLLRDIDCKLFQMLPIPALLTHAACSVCLATVLIHGIQEEEDS